MTFEDILDQAISMLQRRGRLTYRTLQRQFQLDDTAMEDLKLGSTRNALARCVSPGITPGPPLLGHRSTVSTDHRSQQDLPK